MPASASSKRGFKTIYPLHPHPLATANAIMALTDSIWDEEPTRCMLQLQRRRDMYSNLQVNPELGPGPISPTWNPSTRGLRYVWPRTVRDPDPAPRSRDPQHGHTRMLQLQGLEWRDHHVHVRSRTELPSRSHELRNSRTRNHTSRPIPSPA